MPQIFFFKSSMSSYNNVKIIPNIPQRDDFSTLPILIGFNLRTQKGIFELGNGSSSRSSKPKQWNVAINHYVL